MNNDLKIIKKKYGEDMMHFCRENFSSLLETEGLLSKILMDHFDPSHMLYDDIVSNTLESDFKNYIYSLVAVENNNEIIVNKTPKELLSDVGYKLFECTTEEEIQNFKKYYASGEELCTFSDNRLQSCYVFFAVKKDVENIKREDFKNPNRQDAYGTSVISIQFTKDETNTLSIKNRYNHTVNNPDATFSNNLDNIIPGLTKSFENAYGIVQKHKGNGFEILNYVQANDGKYYKYNYEINNIYYCPNNIIIDNYQVNRLEKEKYVVFDYFVLDLINKKLSLYNTYIGDSFLDTISDVSKIRIENKEKVKDITIIPKYGEDIIITLDKQNRLIGYKNNNIKEIGDYFLYYNDTLLELNLFNVEIIESSFLFNNQALKKLNLPNIREIGNFFMHDNCSLIKLLLPKLEIIGNSFLFYNQTLTELSLPNIKVIDAHFLYHNRHIKMVELPNLEKVDNYFLRCNDSLLELSLPNLETVGDSFLYMNCLLKKLDLPNLKKTGNGFLMSNINILDFAILDDDFRKQQIEMIETKKKVKQFTFGCLR
ncbi:MAG: leucine-rich repeat protein [Bacilli bacterium]